MKGEWGKFTCDDHHDIHDYDYKSHLALVQVSVEILRLDSVSRLVWDLVSDLACELACELASELAWTWAPDLSWISCGDLHSKYLVGYSGLAKT